MKPLKYIIFFLILCNIFTILYRNCDRKGLVRYWISFKMAVYISLILAGLIPGPVEATNPRVSNDLPPMERIVNLSGSDQSKFGPGARAKVDARRNAKGSGSFMIPGADEFVSSRNYRPYQKPLSARRPGKIQKGPFDPDQEQGKGRCKSNRDQTEKYTIESKIHESNTLSKISTKVRKVSRI